MVEFPFKQNRKEIYGVLADEPVMKTIIYKLGLIRVNVELLSVLHLYDINIFAENFFNNLFCIVRNATYENLNLSKPNSKAIDIVDNINKIAIQITSENTSKKVTKTIEKFKETEYYKNGYELQIFIISEKNTKSTENNVLYIEDLLKEIYKLPNSQKNKVNEYLKESINLSITDAIIDNTDFNNPKRPNNLKKFFETLNTGFNENEDKGNLEVINKYIDRLCLIDYKTRCYFNIFARIMYKLKDNKNMVSSYPDQKKYLKLTAIEHNIDFSYKEELLEIIQYLEDMNLIIFDQNWATGNDKMISFKGIDGWYDLVLELMEFANKNNIDSKEIFVNLDFSLLEDKNTKNKQSELI